MKVLRYLEALVVGITIYPVAVLGSIIIVDVLIERNNSLKPIVLIPILVVLSLPICIKKAYKESGESK